MGNRIFAHCCRYAWCKGMHVSCEVRPSRGWFVCILHWICCTKWMCFTAVCCCKVSWSKCPIFNIKSERGLGNCTAKYVNCTAKYIVAHFGVSSTEGIGLFFRLSVSLTCDFENVELKPIFFINIFVLWKQI